MDANTILSYQLPNVRCVTCNKPIAHLYEEYKNLLDMKYPAIDIYNMLDLKNVCCRTEIGFAKHIIITKPNEYKILGIDEPNTTVLIPSVTPLKKGLIKPISVGKSITIQTKIKKSCIPVSITVGSKTTKLNDELCLSYMDESIYMAQ